MPNRSERLEWESAADPAGRTRIVDAALAIADEEGLDAVSVRRVGQRVGRRPMSLYSHVPSKDGLVALMFDRISAGLLLPEPPPDDGRERFRLIATRAFDTYLAHPWMLHAFGRRPPPGPNQKRRAEQSARAAEALGVDPADAHRALSIVHEWTMGHALHVITLREDAALARAVGGDVPGRFEDGLEAVLDGVLARYGRPRGA